jgi:alpha-tubulin suppressor-like RCC1 family protein
VGNRFTCAVLSTGAAKCWGGNGSGQLGDGTITDRTTPIDVSGLSSGVSAISVGNRFTCAVLSTGAAKCWGGNGSGQLGDGTITDRTTPVAVSGLSSGVSAIATGSNHTCALLNTGAVKCWGQNSNGVLGDGTTTWSNFPVNVSGLSSGVSAISAGGQHTCALLSTGGVKCWGTNSSGQIGDGTITNSSTPVNVSGLSSGVTAISTGFSSSCALLSTGAVKCWGGNGSGQLGDGTTTDRSTPIDVSGLSSGVRAISAGYGNTCALLGGGVVKCWGSNYIGQLGDGTTTQRLTPTAVVGLP